jgi:TRAP-type uncharacterized transport system substrate-binding protein
MGWERGVFFRAFLAVLAVVAAGWLALWYFIPAPPATITIGAGTKGAAYEHVATKYRERLARDHVKVDIVFGRGSVETVDLLNDPKSGLDAGLMLGSVADRLKAPDLVSLGRINYAPIWFFSLNAKRVEDFSHFKGKRVSLDIGSGRAVAKVLAAYGVTPENTTLLELTSPDAIKALRSGEVDVISSAGGVDSPFAQTLLRDPTVHVMDVTQADALTRLFPSLNRLVLPRGIVDLEKNIPATDVNLIALTSVVVARANLHPEIIYLLAKTMKDEHSRGGIFHRPGDFPTQTDPDLPMAEEAVDYYKNGPSYLQRYLPFWMINYTKRVAAILLTVIAVVIPIFTYGPKAYEWFVQAYLKKLYRRLRAIDARLQKDLTVTEVAALRSDLDHINRAASVLPMRHSDMFFSMRHHIDQTRALLASRLAALLASV